MFVDFSVSEWSRMPIAGIEPAFQPARSGRMSIIGNLAGIPGEMPAFRRFVYWEEIPRGLTHEGNFIMSCRPPGLNRIIGGIGEEVRS